jgi:DNA primase small subunit
LNERTKGFLRHAYRQYYFSRADSVEFPKDIQSREFGYIPFGGSMVRHLSFASAGEAIAELLKQAPSSVYCSNARYDSPSLPMEEKGWKGAELIFDIDSTDIPTSCKKSHDVWMCENCHNLGRLPKPPQCPKCSGKTSELKGTCGICLGASREHAERVIDFLANDFGVSPDDVKVYFSGNRGFHLHVFDERFNLLDQQARGEITDYIRGDSLPHFQTLASILRHGQQRNEQNEAAWMKRISGYVEAHKKGYTGTMQKLVTEAVTFQKALVDSSVTTDIHRVFRLAGTLHGNTGMCKKRVASLDSFDPASAVALGTEPVRVDVVAFPRYYVGGESFGPFKSTTATLPTHAAVPILARSLGEVLQ